MHGPFTFNHTAQGGFSAMTHHLVINDQFSQVQQLHQRQLDIVLAHHLQVRRDAAAAEAQEVEQLLREQKAELRSLSLYPSPPAEVPIALVRALSPAPDPVVDLPTSPFPATSTESESAFSAWRGTRTQSHMIADRRRRTKIQCCLHQLSALLKEEGVSCAGQVEVMTESIRMIRRLTAERLTSEAEKKEMLAQIERLREQHQLVSCALAHTACSICIRCAPPVSAFASFACSLASPASCLHLHSRAYCSLILLGFTVLRLRWLEEHQRAVTRCESAAVFALCSR